MVNLQREGAWKTIVERVCRKMPDLLAMIFIYNFVRNKCNIQKKTLTLPQNAYDLYELMKFFIYWLNK